MLIGYLLKSKTPDGLLNTLAFVIFSIFGVYTLYQGLKLISSSVCRIPVLLILIAVVVIFAGLCAFLFVRQKKKKRKKYRKRIEYKSRFVKINSLNVNDKINNSDRLLREIVEIVPFLFDIIQETHKDISYY